MTESIIALCADYHDVIIWGYGHLGKYVNRLLYTNNIIVSAIWDNRYKEIQNQDFTITEPLSDFEESEKQHLVIVCVGKRIMAEQIKYEIMTNTNFDCILAIDYGFGNEDKLSMLEFNLNIGCSLNCKYCPQDKFLKSYCGKYGITDRYMSFDKFRHIVDTQLNPCALIAFSGMSEPFENPDFIPMVEYAFNKGFRIFINTTLMGMDEEKFLRISKIDVERIFLHIPDEEHNSKFKITSEYLGLLDRFIECFFDRIGRFSCHSEKEDGRISYIINKYNINTLSGVEEFCDRAGNLDLLAQNIRHEGEVVCALGETSVFAHVVMPNGELALCCNDYGLEGNLGNLLDNRWEEIYEQDGYRQYIKGITDCKNNFLCRRCEYAYEKNWAIEHLYPNYCYEYSNYLRMMLRKSDYLAGLDVGGASYFRKIIGNDYVCLIGLEDNLGTNAFFDNGWNKIIKANFYSGKEALYGLDEIQEIKYIALDDIDFALNWVMVILSCKNRKIEKVLDEKGCCSYFYFSDFVQA